jgi:hypothetical protein
MPLVTPSRPVAVLEPAPSLHRSRALAEVRSALAMIAADPVARQLQVTSTDATASLTDWLYARWWCGPHADGGPSLATPAGAGREAARGVARLEAARRTTARTDPGWLVLAAAGDLVVAARASTSGSGNPPEQVRVGVDDVVGSSRPGLPPRPGDLVTLQRGSSGLDSAGAWWWAHTGHPADLADTDLDRWYVHARDLTAAAVLVPLLLDTAAEAGCPLSLKCSPYESGYGRRDALVGYLPRSVAAVAEAALRSRSAAIAGLVEADVPPLTCRLLPGIAQAEDPGPAADTDTGVSYGQLRCSQVAAVAVRVGLAGALTDAALAAELATVGIDVDAAQRVL